MSDTSDCARLPFAARRDPCELAAPDDLVAVVRELLAEVRGLRADLRRQREAGAPALRHALADYFGAGRFTVSGILELAADDPHSELADALADVVDMNAPARSRATALGVLLRRLPAVEIVAEQRGRAVYRLRTSGG